MSRNVLEKLVCEVCGVDVRENTLYCYNCGSRIAEAQLPTVDLKEDNPSIGQINEKGRETLEDLSERIKIENKPDDGDSIARAAVKRKLSRSAKKKGAEYAWEPVNDPPGRLMLTLVGLIVLLSTLAVVMTVIWK